jgi:hypothetical protein
LEEEIPEMLEELHNWILPSTKSEVFNGSSWDVRACRMTLTSKTSWAMVAIEKNLILFSLRKISNAFRSKPVVDDLTEEHIVIMNRIEKKGWVLSFCVSQININKRVESSERNRKETLNLRNLDRFTI